MVLPKFEQFVRHTANRLGIDVHRYRPEQSSIGRLSRMLAVHDINVVLDVGANTGQFGRNLRDAGYAKRIVSFEPLSTAHSQLLDTSSKDGNWIIAPRVAIGSQEGEITINIAGNLVSSSVLKMLNSHISAAPNSSYTGSERVRVCALDSIAPSYLPSNATVFLKVDTQGYEQQVLDGAGKLLQEAKGIQLELSLVPLYEGQHLFDSLASRLAGSGFSIWSIEPGFCDTRNGRMLQVDAVFFRD